MDRTAERTRIEGVVIGVLMGFADDGAPLVVYPGNPSEAALAARTTAVLTPEDVGREVALLFEGGDPARPLVVGRLVRPEATPALVVRDGWRRCCSSRRSGRSCSAAARPASR